MAIDQLPVFRRMVSRSTDDSAVDHRQVVRRMGDLSTDVPLKESHRKKVDSLMANAPSTGTGSCLRGSCHRRDSYHHHRGSCHRGHRRHVRVAP